MDRENAFIKLVTYNGEGYLRDILNLMQNLENANAKFYGRAPREVVFKKLDTETFGLFSLLNPDTLIISNSSINSPKRLGETVTHEGLHALCYDYFKGKANLHIFSNMLNLENSRNEFYNEQKLDDIIRYVSEAEGDIDLFYYTNFQERFVRHETLLTLFDNIIKSCDNQRDYNSLLPLCNLYLSDYRAYKNRLKQDMNDYKNIVKEANGLQNYSPFKCHTEKINPNGNITQRKNSGLLQRALTTGLGLANDFAKHRIGIDEYGIRQIDNLSNTAKMLKR